MNRLANGAREALLTVGACLGVFCFLAAVAAVAFGVQPLIFRSGSMAPAISTGDLALARTVHAASLEPGQVVSVVNDSGIRVTHRVVSIGGSGPSRQLTLQGDRNSTPDAQTYDVSSAARVMFAIPKAGYLANAAMSPVGIFGAGAFVTTLMMMGFGGRRDGPLPVAAPASTAKHLGVAAPPSLRLPLRLIVAVGLLGILVAAPAARAAPWTDAVPITASTFTSYTVPKPAIVSCTVTGGALSQKTATIIWTEVSSPFALDYTATIQETGTSMTVTDLGSTRRVQFTAGLLSTVLNATYNVRIQAKLPAPNGAWVSVEANQPVTITLLGLGMICGTAS